jgi:hypothetical protein
MVGELEKIPVDPKTKRVTFRQAESLGMKTDPRTADFERSKKGQSNRRLDGLPAIRGPITWYDSGRHQYFASE